MRKQMTDVELVLLYSNTLTVGKTEVRLVYESYLQNVFTNHIRGSLNKFPDLFRMDTFIDSTHMKL